MAQINKPSDYFNTKLYTGNGSYGHGITGVGFQPDFVWIKSRSNADNHNLYDAVRGTDKSLLTNGSNTEATSVNRLHSFDSDGFTVDDHTPINRNGGTHVSWNWKAGTTGSGYTTGSGASNSYSYSVNTTAGFSIINYVGNGTAGHTIPHHLGATPSFIIVKNRDTSSGAQWCVYHKDAFTSQSAPGVLYLNTTAAKSNDTNVWGNSTVTIDSTVFSVGDYHGTNKTNDNIIAYCFAEKTGYSKFGSYTGNGNADGTFVYTGFKPAWFLLKKTDGANAWYLYDNKRANGSNVNDDALSPNNNDAEFSSNMDFLSNGVKIRTSGTGENASGSNFIYMAFAEQPLVGTNNIPATGR